MKPVLRPPFPELRRSPGRAKVLTAAAALQHALNQLSGCLEEERARERREDSKRRADVDVERRVAELSRAAATRIALRESMVSVDRVWFWGVMNELLDDWRAAARAARSRSENMRANSIDARVDALQADLTKIEERQRLFGGSQ